MIGCGSTDRGVQSVLFYIAGLAYLNRHPNFRMLVGGIVDERQLHQSFHRYALISPWADPDDFPVIGQKVKAISDAFSLIKHMTTKDSMVSIWTRPKELNRLFLDSLPQSFIGRHFTIPSSDVAIFADVVRRHFECIACIEEISRNAFYDARCATEALQASA
ncbi:MAG: hypothetical protein WA051_02285 [Minisyncoccia bacterium]